MSAAHPGFGHPMHGDGFGEEHCAAAGHGSRRGYLAGFVLSVVLTAVPFILVMTGMIASTLAVALIIFGLAFAQIFVHAVFFLHLDARAEGGWTLLAFLFTAVIVAITIAGSIWIMVHLNTNMMLSMPPDPSQSAPGAMPEGGM